MLIIVLFIFSAIVGVFCLVVGIAIGRVGRDQLRLELANLKGKHETLSQAYIDLRRIAGECLKLAQQRQFPEQTISPAQHETLEKQFDFNSVKPNITLARSENCRRCSVSVRSIEWPVKCPNCGTSIYSSEANDEWPDEVG